MKYILSKRIGCFFLSFLLLLASCSDDNNEVDELKNELELLKNELINQKKLVELLQNNITITDIDYGEGRYTINFSDHQSITLTNGKTPIINIGTNGNWYIDGKDTGLPSRGEEGKAPSIAIDANGCWLIDGQQTGIKAMGLDGKDAPVIISIVDGRDEIVVVFSDKTVITVKKNTESIVPFFKNNTLPCFKDTIRILCLGNSYTDDATDYLNDLCIHAGLDPEKLGVYTFVSGGASLKRIYDFYKNNDSIKINRRAGNLQVKKTNCRFQDILAQDWDVVVLQQLSGLAIEYKSFNPYLRNLITGIRLHCKNQRLALAWQQVWAYWTGYGGEPTGIERFNRICECVKKQEAYDGIDIVIPVGTAIQNARNTTLQTPHDLTRDGIHLSFGVGKYIAACTWFQTILAPIYNKGIKDNQSIHLVSDFEKSFSKYESVDVTTQNNMLCQLCAIYACLDHYKVNSIQ